MMRQLLILLVTCSVAGCLFSAQSDAGGMDRLRQSIVRTAERFIGTRYVYGKSGKTGFDCSGFTQYIFARHGISLPRESEDQYERGHKIHLSKAKKGDLLFFRINGYRISHVGLYIGNGKFIHAPRTGRRVSIAGMNNRYWKNAYCCAATYILKKKENGNGFQKKN